MIATVAGTAGVKMGSVERPSQSCVATQNLLYHPSHVCHMQPMRNGAPCPTLPLTVTIRRLDTQRLLTDKQSRAQEKPERTCALCGRVAGEAWEGVGSAYVSSSRSEASGCIGASRLASVASMVACCSYFLHFALHAGTTGSTRKRFGRLHLLSVATRRHPDRPLLAAAAPGHASVAFTIACSSSLLTLCAARRCTITVTRTMFCLRLPARNQTVASLYAAVAWCTGRPMRLCRT